MKETGQARYLHCFVGVLLVLTLFQQSCRKSEQTHPVISPIDAPLMESPKPTPTSRAEVQNFPKAPRLVWLTLDALHKTNLEPYLSRIKSPHSHGLVSILNSSNGRQGLNVGYPSITAPSHISTMTCGRPGDHGVFLNGGNWNGEKDLNGFAMAYSTETWVQALRKTGHNVAVASYPSVDGSTPERSADLGIAYDNPVGKVQYIKLGNSAEPSIESTANVEVSSHLIPNKKYSLTLRRSSTGEVTVQGEFGTAKLVYGKAVDLFGTDGTGMSERRAAVSFLDMGLQKGSWVVAVSPVSIMPVVGDELKLRLDQKNIVWSNLRDYGYANYDHGVDFILETIRHRRHAELMAIKEMIAIGTADAMFLYFEDLDVVLHAWMGVAELDDKISEFLAEFDQDLGNFLQSFPESTNLLAVGDHGMSAIQYEINARSLLPAGTAANFQLRVSGGTMALYPLGALASEPTGTVDLEAVVQTLRDATVEFDQGRKVFAKVVTRDSAEAKALGIGSKISPWIMAFANDGIAIQNRIDGSYLTARRESFVVPENLRDKYPDPMNSGRLVVPTPLGAHGHDSNLDVMKTFLYLSGPDFKNLDLATVTSNTMIVPAVAGVFGWEKPASCK